MNLTSNIRSNILYSAMKSLPTANYMELLVPVVQNVLYAFMPTEIKVAYDNPETRKYLHSFEVLIKEGNGYNGSSGNLKSGNGIAYLYGSKDQIRKLEVRVDKAVMMHLKEGTLNHALSKAVINSGLFSAYVEQSALIESVRIRLRSTLDSVRTTKRLYEVLEPELHYLVPKDNDKTANLPANVAPIVDDLRKLGAVLPEVNKG